MSVSVPPVASQRPRSPLQIMVGQTKFSCKTYNVRRIPIRKEKKTTLCRLGSLVVALVGCQCSFAAAMRHRKEVLQAQREPPYSHAKFTPRQTLLLLFRSLHAHLGFGLAQTSELYAYSGCISISRSSSSPVSISLALSHETLEAHSDSSSTAMSVSLSK